MIRTQDFQNFQQIAEELLILFDEGCELYQVYPLLKRWQAVLNAIPKSERSKHPWIVCDLPEQPKQSYIIHTTHPTKADDSWFLEWMPADLSEDDQQEACEHLRKMFAAWLRVVKRDEINCGHAEANTAGVTNATYSDRSAGKWFGVDPRTIVRWRSGQDFPKSPVTFEEASRWASTNKWAKANNKRIVHPPNGDKT